MDQLISSNMINRSSPVPLYFQVAQRLQQLIESGELPPGTRLDNEIALADQLGLSRSTMRQAIQHLVDRGLLVRKRGIGTQVAHPRIRRQLELSSLYDDLDRTRRHPRSTVLSFAVVPAPDAVATALGLPPGSAVVAIERLRYAENEPLAIMRNYLPDGIAEITTELLTERGLYQLLRDAGVSPRTANQTIGARNTNAVEARLLGEAHGAPLLTMSRTVFDDDDTAVEYGNHVYRASRYSFEMTLVAR